MPGMLTRIKYIYPVWLATKWLVIVTIISRSGGCGGDYGGTLQRTPMKGNLITTTRPILDGMTSTNQSEAQYQSQVTALAWMMQPAAEQAARVPEAGTARRDLNIIDTGAGAEVWSLTIAAHDVTARVTAADWPSILKIAATQAHSRGLADRFASLPGNYHEIELPAATYGLAIVGNVTHIETESGNRSLFEKLYTSLRSGGVNLRSLTSCLVRQRVAWPGPSTRWAWPCGPKTLGFIRGRAWRYCSLRQGTR